MGPYNFILNHCTERLRQDFKPQRRPECPSSGKVCERGTHDQDPSLGTVAKRELRPPGLAGAFPELGPDTAVLQAASWAMRAGPRLHTEANSAQSPGGTGRQPEPRASGLGVVGEDHAGRRR